MDNHVILHDCVSFAIKFGFTAATFDAHIYPELVDIYILAGDFARDNVDSGYCVPYTESC